MLFNSYSYEILYEQFHWIYLQGDIKLLLITVNNRLKFEIEIVHDLSCHPIELKQARMGMDGYKLCGNRWERCNFCTTQYDINWSTNRQVSSRPSRCQQVAPILRDGKDDVQQSGRRHHGTHGPVCRCPDFPQRQSVACVSVHVALCCTHVTLHNASTPLIWNN